MQLLFDILRFESKEWRDTAKRHEQRRHDYSESGEESKAEIHRILALESSAKESGIDLAIDRIRQYANEIGEK